MFLIYLACYSPRVKLEVAEVAIESPHSAARKQPQQNREQKRDSLRSFPSPDPGNGRRGIKQTQRLTSQKNPSCSNQET